jgi:CRP-like cAMP-binding protein
MTDNKNPVRAVKKKRAFDPSTFLATIDVGRKMVAVPKRQAIFTQGDAADAVFYIQKAESGSPYPRPARKMCRKRVVSKISQETLAEMVGTNRSRVSFFMNRFRKIGVYSLQRRHCWSTARCSM